jgi:hypothetical protein
MGILNEVIFSTKFTVEDLVYTLNPKLRKKFLKLPATKQKELIDNYSREIAKGLESGIMHDWDYVMRIAVDNSGFLEELGGDL